MSNIISKIEQYLNESISNTKFEIADCSECLYYPQTTPIIPVKFVNTYKKIPSDITNLTKWSKVLPHIQFWSNGRGKLRLSDDIKRTDDVFIFDKTGFICDGPNQNSIAIVAKQIDNKSQIYILRQSLPSTKTGDDIANNLYATSEHTNMQPILSEKGRIYSIMLKQDNDELLYSAKDNNQSMFYIYNINKEENNCSLKAQAFMPALFKKIISLGNTTEGIKKGLGNVYLCLTKEGDLYFSWMDEKNSIQYAKQTLPKTWEKYIDPDDKKKKRIHQKKVWNIAVNPQTTSTLCNKIAIIDDYGDVYVSDIIAFKPIVLFYTYNMLRQEYRRQVNNIYKTAKNDRTWELKQSGGFRYTDNHYSYFYREHYYKHKDNLDMSTYFLSLKSNYSDNALKDEKESGNKQKYNYILKNSDNEKVLECVEEQDLFDAAKFNFIRNSQHNQYVEKIAKYLIYNRFNKEYPEYTPFIAQFKDINQLKSHINSPNINSPNINSPNINSPNINPPKIFILSQFIKSFFTSSFFIAPISWVSGIFSFFSFWK